MHLIYKDTKRIVMVGDNLTTFRGEQCVLMQIEKPHKPSSTGRIYVRFPDTVFDVSFFPGVCNLEWEGRTDR